MDFKAAGIRFVIKRKDSKGNTTIKDIYEWAPRDFLTPKGKIRSFPLSCLLLHLENILDCDGTSIEIESNPRLEDC